MNKIELNVNEKNMKKVALEKENAPAGGHNLQNINLITEMKYSVPIFIQTHNQTSLNKPKRKEKGVISCII